MPGYHRQRVLLTRLAALVVFVLGVALLVQLVLRAQHDDSVLVSPVGPLSFVRATSTPTPTLRAHAIATQFAQVQQHPPAPLPTVTPDATSTWVTVQHLSGSA